MAYVKVENSVIVQKQPNQESGFEQAPEDVVVGYVKNDDGTFSPPPGPSEQKLLDTARDNAMQRIQQGHADALAAIHERYPQLERDGWAQQERQAHQHKAGERAPMIERMANKRGMTKDEVADGIIANAESFSTAYADATATLSEIRNKVDSAYHNGETDALNSIEWPGE